MGLVGFGQRERERETNVLGIDVERERDFDIERWRGKESRFGLFALLNFLFIDDVPP